MPDLNPSTVRPSPSAEGTPTDGRPRGGSLLAQISNAMHEFVGAVERLTGRKVQAFISEIHAATNMGIELFVLEPAEPPADPSAEERRNGE